MPKVSENIKTLKNSINNLLDRAANYIKLYKQKDAIYRVSLNNILNMYRSGRTLKINNERSSRRYTRPFFKNPVDFVIESVEDFYRNNSKETRENRDQVDEVFKTTIAQIYELQGKIQILKSFDKKTLEALDTLAAEKLEN